VQDWQPHRIAALLGEVRLKLPRFLCTGCGCGETDVSWPSHCRSTPEPPGEHHGFVDEFDAQGHLVQRIVSGGPLDSPWGLAIAPASFGKFAGDLLVGNFGNGTIDAFNLATDKFEGKLLGANDKPLVIDDLWALIPGNNGTNVDPNALYFTAGGPGAAHGLLGSLTLAPVMPHDMHKG
jgi:uncharacterized protein (TIGR03118 family)